MTVRELIEKLGAVPPETEVLVADWNEEYGAPAPLTCMQFYETDCEVVLEERGPECSQL